MSQIEKTYADLLSALKTEIQTSRIRAHLSVNKEMILLYWRIGRKILEQQADQGWGAKVIETLSNDLRQECPSMKGLGRANLLNMRRFA